MADNTTALSDLDKEIAAVEHLASELQTEITSAGNPALQELADQLEQRATTMRQFLDTANTAPATGPATPTAPTS